jgi:predicted Zn finger-like uncharacterized protein
MNLTTHCPRCATAFLVTQEQLGEAQGWVRCGMCQEVFIAQAHTAAPPQAPPLEAPLPHQQEALHTDEPRLDDDSTPAPAPTTTSAPTPMSATSAATSTPLPNRPESIQAPPAHPAPSPSPPHASPAPRKPGGPSGRLLLGALLALLALQIGLQARHSLADAFPQATSWLQSLCPAGRCGLREISAVAIEDSSFTTTGPNLFHLSAMVANRSNLVLDAPVLALTLTDAADQVLARKVYSPQDWGAAGATLSGGTRTPAALWIQWEDASTTQRVVGYRLQAFYP